MGSHSSVERQCSPHLGSTARQEGTAGSAGSGFPIQYGCYADRKLHTAAPDEAIRQLVSKTQTRCKIVHVGMNQRTVKPTGGVTCGRHNSPAVGRRKVCSIVFPLHDG